MAQKPETRLEDDRKLAGEVNMAVTFTRAGPVTVYIVGTATGSEPIEESAVMYYEDASARWRISLTHESFTTVDLALNNARIVMERLLLARIKAERELTARMEERESSE